MLRSVFNLSPYSLLIPWIRKFVWYSLMGLGIVSETMSKESLYGEKDMSISPLEWLDSPSAGTA